MKQDTSKQGEGPFIPPVSAFAGPIAELVGHRLLSPPTRPGLLASLGGYEVARVLGGGGMGVVVLARDTQKWKDVAIKLIRPELVSNQQMVHRFVKEAGHLQKLKHPNVVPVFEVSDRPEGPFFVMPYFESGSLGSRIRPGRPMESCAVLDIARQVADGLSFAHRHGIIHRDLKPANILLAGDGTSCLADFGLARTMFNDTLIDVEREQLEGTAPYMSPGVAAGNAEDTRCDIYAFGALLYEMLTGDPPYAGRTTNDILKQILDGPPKPILTRNPAADAGLVTVAEGAMARELRDRYADMADVLGDLDRIKAGKAAVGPRGATGRAKQRPASLWIPAGIGLIALGLWLLWPPAPEKKPDTKPVPISPMPIVTQISATTAPPVRAPQVPVTPAPHVPAPPITPKPTVTPGWQVDKLAGQPGAPGSADGPVATASFRTPGGIAVDALGNIYVADTGNNAIRKISRDGEVSTLAGQAGRPGRSDGSGPAARFLAPMGIAVDILGNVYVAEFASDTIRKITPDGTVSTLAGSAGIPGSEDGAGDNAHFRNPWSVAVDGAGNVYVADRSNCAIRQITPTGRVSTFAGLAGKTGYVDGPGSYARFADPQGVAVDGTGDVYVADTGNHVVRKIDRSGVVSTLAGATGARFSNVQALAVKSAVGSLYVLDGDAVREIDAAGVVATLPVSLLTDSGGRAIHPTSIATDRIGNLYLVEESESVMWELIPPHGLDPQHRWLRPSGSLQ